MIGGPHEGFELSCSYNLDNPNTFDNTFQIDRLKHFLISLPNTGRYYKKEYPKESFWDMKDIYFTHYRGRGQKNKGDRMVNFYQKVPEIDMKEWFRQRAEEEKDEPLY